jgi:cytolysin-activating lysine-acyltransferase
MNTTANSTTTAKQSADMNVEDMTKLAALAKEQAKLVMGKIPLLGPVTWLMMQQGATRHTLLSELEWRVLPALVLDQAKLYMRENAPIAYVSWAKLSEVTVERYKTAPHHLTSSDWKSGDQVWIIDLFTPFGGAQEVMKDLREVVFKGVPVHQLIPNTTGQAKTLTWPAVA